jgi:hypothetical protein
MIQLTIVVTVWHEMLTVVLTCHIAHTSSLTSRYLEPLFMSLHIRKGRIRLDAYSVSITLVSLFCEILVQENLISNRISNDDGTEAEDAYC